MSKCGFLMQVKDPEHPQRWHIVQKLSTDLVMMVSLLLDLSKPISYTICRGARVRLAVAA